MNVGLYYHVEFVVDGSGRVHVPAHFGVLLDGLAKAAGHLTFYGHRGTGVGNEDHVLDERAVTVVDLGPIRSNPARTFRPAASLRSFRPRADGVDVVIAQGPSALLPALVRRSDVPTALLLWGDMTLWRGAAAFPWWRNALIRSWIRLYTSLQRRASRGRLVITNNPSLANTVRSDRVEVVPISSVPASALASIEPRDAGWEAGKGSASPVKLIYSGRINRRKGLFEAVDAVRILADRGYNVTLELVGWEEPGDPTIDALTEHVRSRGVSERVAFAGYVPAGAPLLARLANADVFVIPTYWESLPRALLEGMAVGLPAIVTPVGGIGHFLSDRKTAIFIEPRSPVAVADAVQELIEDADLRRHVASRGTAWARDLTVERSCAIIMSHLRALAASTAATA